MSHGCAVGICLEPSGEEQRSNRYFSRCRSVYHVCGCEEVEELKTSQPPQDGRNRLFVYQFPINIVCHLEVECLGALHSSCVLLASTQIE